jgi:hypothetical protein
VATYGAKRSSTVMAGVAAMRHTDPASDMSST